MIQSLCEMLISTFLCGGFQSNPCFLLMTLSISNTLVTRHSFDVFGSVGLNLEGPCSPGDQMLLILA